MKPFYVLVWEALNDTTLIILMAAAIVSLIIGILENPVEGWIDGAAILFAVFVVSMVSSINDYTKELQFRALEQSSQQDERSSVLRDGQIERLNPVDVVVGDVLIFQVPTSIQHTPTLSIIIHRLVIAFPPIASYAAPMRSNLTSLD